MLKSLMEKREELMARFAKVEESQINDAELRSKFRNLKAKQGGFTLLELLVVVAILAAIAGTAAIALQDTDARASAAAHVAMMDELNKGIRTYRVLNKNQYPNNFDSLLQIGGGAHPFAAASTAADTATFPANDLVAVEDVRKVPLNANARGALSDIGITSLTYLNNGAAVDLSADDITTPGGTDCEAANIVNTISSRSNAVVSNNIFMSPGANGCGVSVPLGDASEVLVWTGGYERVMGQDGVAFDQVSPSFVSSVDEAGADLTDAPDGAPVLLTVGLGPSSNLFNANDLGGMTTVPIYRHVSEQQYGRFVALFEIGTFDTGAVATYTVADQVNLVAIIDGAGDTKEEELGEWDGTRNTI